MGESTSAEILGSKDPVEDTLLLVGYVRRGLNETGLLKLSVNVRTLEDCERYTTADGEEYLHLRINADNLRKVINGERAVTTITHLLP